MRWAWMGLFVLTGCDGLLRSEIKDCEAQLLGELRSPSTYKRIDASSIRANNEQTVRIVYDAANAYGTPIRGTKLCAYPVKGGAVLVDQRIDYDARIEEQARKALTDAENAADAAASGL